MRYAIPILILFAVLLGSVGLVGNGKVEQISSTKNAPQNASKSFIYTLRASAVSSIDQEAILDQISQGQSFSHSTKLSPTEATTEIEGTFTLRQNNAVAKKRTYQLNLHDARINIAGQSGRFTKRLEQELLLGANISFTATGHLEMISFPKVSATSRNIWMVFASAIQDAQLAKANGHSSQNRSHLNDSIGSATVEFTPVGSRQFKKEIIEYSTINALQSVAGLRLSTVIDPKSETIITINNRSPFEVIALNEIIDVSISNRKIYQNALNIQIRRLDNQTVVVDTASFKNYDHIVPWQPVALQKNLSREALLAGYRSTAAHLSVHGLREEIEAVTDRNASILAYQKLKAYLMVHDSAASRFVKQTVEAPYDSPLMAIVPVALAACGSDNTLKALQGIIDGRLRNHQPVKKLLPLLASSKRMTKAVVDYLIKMQTNEELSEEDRSTATLAVGSAINSFRENNPESYRGIVANWLTKLQSRSDQDHKIHYLLAIGNSGAEEAAPKLTEIASSANTVRIRTEATYALHFMDDDYSYNALLTLASTASKSQVKAAAFKALSFRTKSDEAFRLATRALYDVESLAIASNALDFIWKNYSNTSEGREVIAQVANHSTDLKLREQAALLQMRMGKG